MKISIVILVSLAFLSHVVFAEQLPIERGRFTMTLPKNGKEISVSSYRPQEATSRSPIIFVLTGLNRNADDYRDAWIEHAQKNHFIVLVPEFSKKDYPGVDGYNLGSLVNNDLRRVNPPEDWAFTVIDAIFESLRQSKITEQPRYYLFGNSAGCQFVHRMLTFVPTAKVKAAICAAAGWWTLLDDETTWPYGLANAPVVLKTTELERYFAMPLLITVGQRDNDPYHPLLRRSYEAMAQGNNRLQRAENYFLTGKQKASRYKFPFNWQFTTVPDVAHSGSKMSAWAATQFVQFEKSGAFLYQY